MDSDLCCTCIFYDSWFVVFLRRSGAAEKRCEHDVHLGCHDCDGNRDVDAVRLLAFVRTGSRRCDR